MFETGDRVREIETGDEGTIGRHALDEDSGIDGYYVAWDCYNGALLWIEADAIEAVQDAS